MKWSGRGIRRLVTLCGTVTQLVAENDRRLLNPDPNSDDGGDGDDNADDDDDEDLTPENKEDVKRRVFWCSPASWLSHGQTSQASQP